MPLTATQGDSRQLPTVRALVSSQHEWRAVTSHRQGWFRTAHKQRPWQALSAMRLNLATKPTRIVLAACVVWRDRGHSRDWPESARTGKWNLTDGRGSKIGVL